MDDINWQTTPEERAMHELDDRVLELEASLRDAREYITDLENVIISQAAKSAPLEYVAKGIRAFRSMNGGS